MYWAEDYVIIELPLAKDCKVFNYGEYYNSQKVIESDWYENGDPMTRTLYFNHLITNKESYPYDSGWITIPPFLRVKSKSEATAYSVIVEDGQVKVLELNASPY